MAHSSPSALQRKCSVSYRNTPAIGSRAGVQTLPGPHVRFAIFRHPQLGAQMWLHLGFVRQTHTHLLSLSVRYNTAALNHFRTLPHRHLLYHLPSRLPVSLFLSSPLRGCVEWHPAPQVTRDQLGTPRIALGSTFQSPDFLAPASPLPK